MKSVLLLIACCIAIAGYACPFCNSATAKETRTVLLGPGLGVTLVATLLPFIIFTVAALLVYYWRFGKKPTNNI